MNHRLLLLLPWLHLLAMLPMRAGPITTVITGQSIYGGQAVLNNTWSQSFQAVGTTGSADGGASINPFASSENGFDDRVPASFLELVLTAEPEKGRALATGVAGYSSRAGREDPGLTPRSITSLEVGELLLIGDPGTDPETIAGQVIGRNIGTDLLSVFANSETIPRREDTLLLWN